MKKIISAEDICKVYEDNSKKFEALKEVNVDVIEGEFLGVMGPSGSGKSTLVNILATLDRNTKGKLLINGENVNEINNEELSKFRRENIGFIFQNYNLLNTLTNRDNILAPLLLANIGRDESNKKVEELAKKLDITNLLDKYPMECSGGQKQRVAIARALSNDPKIIIADEPTDSLDVKRGIEIVELLKRLNIEEGITIILVTHDQLIGSYSDRVLLVKEGRIDKELIRDYSGGEDQVVFYKKIILETSKEIEKLFGIV